MAEITLGAGLEPRAARPKPDVRPHPGTAIAFLLLLAWVLTLPSAMLLSGLLYVVLKHLF